MAKFVKGQSGNPAGRPKLGLSFADKVRAITGPDGGKLAEMWAAVAWGYQPKGYEGTSSRALYLTALHTLQREAAISDRVTCSRLLAERGFGRPKETIEHSGSVSLPTTVIHEYHSS